MTDDTEREALSDRLARRLIDDPKQLMLAEGTGALHVALSESIRSVIEDVYADCGDSDPGVLSSNIARRLAGDLPAAILADPGFRRSEVPEPSADMIASEDGMTLEELGNAMLSASDQWDGDESMHSIVYRFIEHYAELDAEIHAAREAVDFEDDVEILFRWDWESGALKRVEASEPQGEPSGAQVLSAARAFAAHGLTDRESVTSLPDWRFRDVLGPMRAALRAAGGVQ